MLHFWIVPVSALADCTLKASPWRTTFKIFVSIMYQYVKYHRQSFVDDAKVGTKKMRSNLLKRIR